jgi:hypothetical protein
MGGGGPRISGGDRSGPRFTDRGGSGRHVARDGRGRHHVPRHRFRGPIAGFGFDYGSYGYYDCYQWRRTAYGWQWVNVCYDYY